MPNYTKLVKCKNHVEIFDYDGEQSAKNFRIEREGYVRLARIIRNNFKVKGSLTYAVLTLPAAPAVNVKEQASKWFTCSKNAAVAVITPLEGRVLLHVVAVDLQELLNQNTSLQVEHNEIITSEVQGVIDTLVKSFDQAVNNQLRKANQFLIEHNLEDPLILRNKKAEDFIKKHHLINCSPYSTTELFDKGGWYSIKRYIL